MRWVYYSYLFTIKILQLILCAICFRSFTIVELLKEIGVENSPAVNGAFARAKVERSGGGAFTCIIIARAFLNDVLPAKNFLLYCRWKIYDPASTEFRTFFVDFHLNYIVLTRTLVPVRKHHYLV